MHSQERIADNAAHASQGEARRAHIETSHKLEQLRLEQRSAEDKVRKASQAQLGASDGGSGRGASQPMTLADAVAIAQANAAAGK